MDCHSLDSKWHTITNFHPALESKSQCKLVIITRVTQQHNPLTYSIVAWFNLRNLTLSNLAHYPRSQLAAIKSKRSYGRKFYISPAAEIFHCVTYTVFKLIQANTIVAVSTKSVITLHIHLFFFFFPFFFIEEHCFSFPHLTYHTLPSHCSSTDSSDHLVLLWQTLIPLQSPS